MPLCEIVDRLFVMFGKLSTINDFKCALLSEKFREDWFNFFATGNFEYADSSTSNDSHNHLLLEEDQEIIKDTYTAENGGNKYIEVIPVHDDDNDITPST